MYVCGRGCECGWVRLCVSAKLDLQHPPHHLPAPPLQAGARQLRRGNGHEQRSTHPHGISSITRRIEIRFASPPYACQPHTPPRNNSTLLPVLHRVHPCMHIHVFVCLCISMRIHAYICMHVCTYIYMSLPVNIRTYIHVDVCADVCVQICVCVCVSICDKLLLFVPAHCLVLRVPV